MKKVLFVCLGNICRSPMAEGMFIQMLKSEKLENSFIVESRATSSWEIGNPPHVGTQKILDRIGFDWRYKKAQKISQSDFELFDIIVAMDHQNVKDLKKIAGVHQHKIHLMLDIDPTTEGMIVPDPYYDGTHEETYRLLSQALPKWIDKLKSSI
jgi:protein-tyrosine phosphatase